ncbi:hypothetical protein ACF0H5_015973 [Mactra antiquata]
MAKAADSADDNGETKDDVTSGEKQADCNGVPIDRGYAWIILAASWWNMLIVNGTYKSLGILFIEIQRKYNSNSSVTSLIVSCLNGTYSVTGLIVQLVVLRHLSSRQCIIIGGLLISTSFILASFAPNVETIIVLIGCIQGIGVGFVFLPTTTNLSQYFKKYRSVANCISIMGGSGGGLLFSYLIPSLVETFSFSGAMMIIGGLQLHMVIFGLLLRPPSFFTQRKQNAKTKVSDYRKQGNILKRNGSEIKSLIQNKPIWIQNVPKCQSTQSLTVAGSPLIKNGNTNDALNSNLSIAARKRTFSENFKSNISIVNQRSLTGIKSASINIGSELSLPSISSIMILNSDLHKGDTEGKMVSKSNCAILSSFIDCSAMRRISFMMYIPCACCLTTLSALQLYIPPFAKDNGLSMNSSSLLITIISITDACANILWGLLADKKFIRIHKIVGFTSALISAITFFAPLFDSHVAFIAYSVTYGIFGRVFFSLYAPVLVDFLGLEYLGSALGIASLAQTACLAALIPVVGTMRDYYSSYSPGLMLLASIILAGSLGIFLLPVGEKCENKRRKVMERTVDVP